MTEEQFKQLGLTDELAKKAAEESAKELEGYVSKQKFDEMEGENKKLKSTIEENGKSLEELKKSLGSNDELKKQIEELQKEAKEKELKYQEELKDSRMTSAIKLSLTGITNDDELVAGLIDRSKLILGEDGKVTGLDEQIKTLKENKAFLFKEEEKGPEQTRPGFRKLGGDPPSSGNKEGKVSLKDAIAAKMNV